MTTGVVRTLVADHMSTTRVPGFKPSSNSTIPEAWITDPATESWFVPESIGVVKNVRTYSLHTVLAQLLPAVSSIFPFYNMSAFL